MFSQHLAELYGAQFKVAFTAARRLMAPPRRRRRELGFLALGARKLVVFLLLVASNAIGSLWDFRQRPRKALCPRPKAR